MARTKLKATLLLIASAMGLALSIPVRAQTVRLTGNHIAGVAKLESAIRLDSGRQLMMEISFALRNRGALERLKVEQQGGFARISELA